MTTQFDKDKYLSQVRKETPEELHSRTEREKEEAKRRIHHLWANFYQNFRFFSEDISQRTIELVKEDNPDLYKMMVNWNIDLQYGFCFAGPVGSGKTYAMTCILNKIVHHLVYADRDPSSEIYWNSTSVLVDEMRDVVRNNEITITDFVKKVQRKQFMFLDDFGAQKTTDFAAEKLMNILDYRSNQNLPTFFSTNCNIKELQESLGERLFSRVIKLSVLVGVNGKDRRVAIHADRLKQLKGLK